MDKQIYIYRDGSHGKFEIMPHQKITFFRDEKDCGNSLILYKYVDDNDLIFARTEKGFHEIFKLYQETIDFPTAMQALIDGKTISQVDHDYNYFLSSDKTNINIYSKDNDKVSNLHVALLTAQKIASKDWYIINA